MKTYTIGDKVSWIDEDLYGVITNVLTNQFYTVETNEGFPIQAHARELVLIPKNDVIKVDFKELNIQLLEKEKTHNKIKNYKRASKQIPALEVDLHIECILENTRGLTNFDMLNKQLDTAQYQLQFARNKRIKRVVFIHGVGEGVLKTELETLLRRHDDLDFYPADVREYGYGATEVYFFERN